MTDARDQLKAFIERVERIEEEIKTLSDDRRDIYAEAKAHGYDTRAMRVIIRKRKLDQEERLNQEQLVETYMVALGMGWGKSDENIDTALDRRRTDAGKAKTARGRQPPPRAQACSAKPERVTSLVHPRHLPSAGRVKAIADRAQGIAPAEVTALSKRKRKSSSPHGRRPAAPAARTRLSESAPSAGEMRPRPGAKTGIDGPGGAAPIPRKARPP